MNWRCLLRLHAWRVTMPRQVMYPDIADYAGIEKCRRCGLWRFC